MIHLPEHFYEFPSLRTPHWCSHGLRVWFNFIVREKAGQTRPNVVKGMETQLRGQVSWKGGS